MLKLLERDVSAGFKLVVLNEGRVLSSLYRFMARRLAHNSIANAMMQHTKIIDA